MRKMALVVTIASLGCGEPRTLSITEIARTESVMMTTCSSVTFDDNTAHPPGDTLSWRIPNITHHNAFSSGISTAAWVWNNALNSTSDPDFRPGIYPRFKGVSPSASAEIDLAFSVSSPVDPPWTGNTNGQVGVNVSDIDVCDHGSCGTDPNNRFGPLSNLAAHEFGHVLGLAKNHGTTGTGCLNGSEQRSYDGCTVGG